MAWRAQLCEEPPAKSVPEPQLLDRRNAKCKTKSKANSLVMLPWMLTLGGSCLRAGNATDLLTLHVRLCLY